MAISEEVIRSRARERETGYLLDRGEPSTMRRRTIRMSLRHAIVRVGYYLGIWHAILILERAFGSKRVALSICYHNFEDIHGGDEPISEMEKGTSVAIFELQIRTLSKWLHVINDCELADWLDRKTCLKSDSLLITFDDAYLDNYTIAYPILKRYGATALIFVPTQYIDSVHSFWWTRLSNAMRAISPERWRALANRDCPPALKEAIDAESLDDFESRRRARRRLSVVIDQENANDVILTLLEAAVDANRNLEVMPLLSWDDIRFMQQDGYSFGGHTHSHPRMTRLSREQIRDEIHTCHRILEEQLTEPIYSFAYPAGDYDERVVQEMRLSKWRLGFTTRPGVILQNSNRFELPRYYFNRSSIAEVYCAIAVLKIAKYFPRICSRLLQRLG